MLTPELLAIAQALGLAQGETIDTTWFSDPLTRLRGILSQPNQRAALFDLLDQIAPPAAVAGTSATAKWHPILGDRANGNLYLTVDTSGSTTLVGVGASYSGTAASLLVDLPLCGLNGSTVTVVAGSDAAPFTASLAVPLGWTRPAHSIALNAILVSVTLTSAIVTLQGLDVDGSGAADAIFDPANLGAESTRLLLGFLREQLHALPGPIAHLVPLLGLDGVTPAFPFATIATDSRALATWLRALTTGSPAPIGGWLAHLAGLLGVASPTVTTGSGGASSWSVPLFAPNATSSVALTITMATAADTVTPLLELGLDVGLVPTGAAPVRVDIAATLVAIPLAGTAGPSAFTNAGISVSAPADQSQSLIPAGPGVTFSVDSVHAGLAWNGTSLAPLIELHNVAIAGIGAFPLVDLHNALTVAGQAASDAVAAAIKAALAGSETGQHLAALAGLVEPASDSSAPLADLTQLLTHPTQTIAGLHRAALVSTTHSWKAYFDEIVGLIGLAGPSSGTGTATDPW
ncbi:MAG TPA: hypothetical protein VK679_05330, partial [Gemmatimonadaceae bacterium]|nr:hypothetical protein [Gemmatimonadaceae bacterium]